MSFVFLICTERSGSNLIRSIMDNHREISGPAPSHLFRLFGLNYQNYHPTQNKQNWSNFVSDFEEAQHNMLGIWDTKIIQKDLLRYCPNNKISEALDYLYCSERKTSEKISFIKENYTYLIIPFILSNWPDAKFVYQVRDPRDVAGSWLKTDSMPGGVEQAVQTWKNDQVETLKILNHMQSSNRLVLIRYEDLINDPEKISLELCSFLNLDYDENMLNFHMNKNTQKNSKRIKAWNNLDKPVIRDNSGKYKLSLTKSDIRYIELSCSTEMKKFDYILNTDIKSFTPSQIKAELSHLRDKISKGSIASLKSKSEQSVRSKRMNIIEKVKSRIAKQ